MQIQFPQENLKSASKEDAAFLGKTPAASATHTLGAQDSKIPFSADALDLHSSTNAYFLASDGEEPKQAKAQDLLKETNATDLALRHDYQILASHTLSQKDYAQLEKEGFHFDALSQAEAVTIVDRIKVELLQSGHEIVGFNDQMDTQTLTEIVGTQTMAQDLLKQGEQSDLPITQENVKEIMGAAEQAFKLETPSEEQVQFMVANQKNPSIQDFYVSQNSVLPQTSDKTMSQTLNATATKTSSQAPVKTSSQTTPPKEATYYFLERQSGYMQKVSKPTSSPQLDAMSKKQLTNLGIEITKSSLENAAWLLENNLPLTADTMKRLEGIREVTFPLDAEKVLSAIVRTMASGERAMDTDLRRTQSVYEEAAKWLTFYGSPDMESAALQIASRRQLEEIRLSMSAEVNVRLLRSGFEIETAPIEALIESLKQAEQMVAKDYFETQQDPVTSYRQYRHAMQEVRHFPLLPARLIAAVATQETDSSFVQISASGRSMQRDYRQAGIEYETMMTRPQSAYGDSIRQAFESAPSLLEELGVEASKENCRAVRILGYNQMEISLQNIEKIRTTADFMDRIVRSMTPQAVLTMIREGVNPMERSFEELENYFQDRPTQPESFGKDFARFLYGMERRGDITTDERSAYVGLFRMIHQVSQKDGAAVGDLIKRDIPLTFKSLLASTRSQKVHFPIQIDDEFAGMEPADRTNAITQQIDQGFGQEYDNIERSRIRQAMQTEPQVMALMQKSQIPISAAYLLAAGEMLHQVSGYADKLSKGSKFEKLLEDSETEADFAEQYQELLQEASDNVETNLYEEDASSEEVYEQLMLRKQIQIARGVSARNEYFVPLESDEETLLLRLRFQHTGEEEGKITISIGSAIEGGIQVKQGSLSGYFAADTKEAVRDLQEASDIFSESVAGEWEIGSLAVVFKNETRNSTQDPRFNDSSQESAGDASVSNQALYRIAKLAIQAIRRTMNKDATLSDESIA
ncbi:MAG: DUF6240 domain-containing protein [Clostridium sp.]|jgi:hypothetical protein|nr:DUF6240 domain-containing protein [Clostridium sp.]